MNEITMDDLQGERVEEQETVLVKGGPHILTWDTPRGLQSVGMAAKTQVRRKQGQ